MLRISELPVLHNRNRLAYLVMQEAHKEDHKWAKEKLWQSRARAWIWRGHSLAKKVVADCIICTKKKKILIYQRKGDLPEN